jgi:N-[(2S)-2-amino-2-carboxyethyl]-L-glutamate dehydrogenase
MPDSDLTIISGSTVRQILDGQEELVLAAVRSAYRAHGTGGTKCPGTQPLYANGGRFFAMPASIEDDQPVIGVKWVASFVANVASGGERAAAMLIANDAATGKPIAIVDGTLISAKRTAAAAAVALQLIESPDARPSLALVGCGPINYEIFRFVAHLFPISRLDLVDLDAARTEAFAARLRAEFPGIEPVASTLDEALERADVVSIATNATTPHIASVPARPFTILHVSLRDLAPSIITSAVNVVDDIEHVCSARTSVHLAELETGHRDFIHATIPRLLSGDDRYARPAAAPTIVSPFGMAILDLAVLREVLARANGQPGITRVSNFREGVWG